MVLFRGPSNTETLRAFSQEFSRLWSWGRTANDRVDETTLSRWAVPSADGKVFLHFSEAQALTWPELESFRARVRTQAPGLLEKLNRKTGACTGYTLSSRSFFGCPPGVN
jgi:hypothetical protein